METFFKILIISVIGVFSGVIGALVFSLISNGEPAWSQAAVGVVVYYITCAQWQIIDKVESK